MVESSALLYCSKNNQENHAQVQSEDYYNLWDQKFTANTYCKKHDQPWPHELPAFWLH